MKMNGTTIKRLIALILTLALVLSSADFVPGVVRAMAEGDAKDASAGSILSAMSSLGAQMVETGEATGGKAPAAAKEQQKEKVSVAVSNTKAEGKSSDAGDKASKAGATREKVKVAPEKEEKAGDTSDGQAREKVTIAVANTKAEAKKSTTALPGEEGETVVGTTLESVRVLISTGAMVAGADGEEEEPNPLQELLEEQINAVKTLDERITLILKKDMTYEGDATLSAGDKKVGKNFVVEFITEEDIGSDRMQATGTTIVAGNITIKGIPVRMVGVAMKSGSKITLDEAKLEYVGTKNTDVLNVEVGKDSEAAIATGLGADSVTVKVNDGKGATILTGAGNDSVTAVSDTRGDLRISTAEGDDTLNVRTVGTGSAEILTGAGNDTVSLYDATTATVHVDTGDNDDVVAADVGAVNPYHAGELKIETGNGNDTVVLSNKNEQAPVTEAERTGSISVDLGAGVNDVTLSTNVASVSPTITISGEKGIDAVHIAGSLIDEETYKKAKEEAAKAENAEEGENAEEAGEGEEEYKDERITGTAEDLQIISDKGALHITTSKIETLTDSLANKRTKVLDVKEANGEVNFTYDQAEPFTNYTINAPAKKLKQIKISGKDGGSMLFSTLVIDTKNFSHGEHQLVIPEGAVIDATGMTLRLTAADIEINGTIKADQVQVEAFDGTNAYGRNFEDQFKSHYDDIKITGDSTIDDIPSIIGGAAETLGDIDMDMVMNLINIEDEATITIGEKGAVLASRDVLISAKVEQNGTLITIIPINVVNVKLANASVNIAGQVHAGVANIGTVKEDLSDIKYDTTKGTVRVDAQVKTTIGYDEDGNMTDGLPLAVSVVYANADVNVKKGAVISAGQDVKIGTRSEIKAATRADSGKVSSLFDFNVPASVAVAVLINDVHTKVQGTISAYGGSAYITAIGSTDARTLADRGEKQESPSGGYAAVTVADQDVKAEIADDAMVRARVGVSVISKSQEKVDNKATAGTIKSEEKEDTSSKGKARSFILDLITNKIWPKVKTFLKGKFESAEKKMEKAFKKVASSNHSVQLDKDATSKGEVSTDVEETDGKLKVTATIIPRTGYKVKSVTWRGYNPGEKKYTKEEVKSEGGLQWEFFASKQNVTLFVEYEEDDGSSDNDSDDEDISALFKEDEEKKNDDEHLDQLLADLEKEVESEEPSDEDLDKQLKEMSDNIKFTNLKLEGDNGSVLTYETKDDDNVNPLKEVFTTQKIELIPNANEGFKLKNGGLKATYSVVEKREDQVVKKTEKTVIINPDAKGQYFFEVPTEMDLETGLKIKGEFEKGQEDKKNNSSMQLTGSVAVVVANNDNQAVIQEKAAVNAADVEVNAAEATIVTNVADGTSALKTTAKSSSGDNDKMAIQRPKYKNYEGYEAEGRKIGLIAETTLNGALQVEQVRGGKKITYAIEATPDEGCKIASAQLVYYKGGKEQTADLTTGDDGKYTVQLTGGDLAIDEGSTALIRFIFVNDAEQAQNGVTAATIGPRQVIVPNPIKITYNAVRDKDYDKITEYIGKVTYQEDKAKKDDDGNITAYAFEAKAETKQGYKLEGNLKATWKNASGVDQSKDLTLEDGVWYLPTDGIPAGTCINVTGTFADDLHEIKADSESTKNGTVKLYDAKVKRTDRPKVTVKANANYALTDIIVTLSDGTKLRKSAGQITEAKDDKGKTIEDTYTFNVPELEEKTTLKVNAEFALKKIGVYAGENDKDKDYSLSAKNVAAGEKVTVTPSADKQKKGYKVTKVTVTDASGKQVAQSTEGSFTVPKDTKDDAKLTVKVEMELKGIVLQDLKTDSGSILSTVARAERGEAVKVTVKPSANFRLKDGTLKAVVVTEDGSTTEVYMSRQNDVTYSFDVPDNIAEDAKLTFKAEFEPGSNGQLAANTSLGAGIAVTVANSENRADIKGTVVSSGNVKAISSISGKVVTQSLAGYSQGAIGMGGAVSVQVASMDSKSLIHKSANITLLGRTIVDASGKILFGAVGNAAGNKKASGIGVGAGVAVSVNGSDVFAAVEDGAHIAGPLARDKINTTPFKGITVTASQSVQDVVQAVAGASGGFAAVPVVAVDVTGSKSYAYLGKISDKQMSFSEVAVVSASTNATHSITSNASVAGGSVGIGAAVSVSVIPDRAIARLNQSVLAPQILVSASNVSSVNETATAGNSGGNPNAKKSADGQANGMMGVGANLAGKNKSSAVSGGGVDKLNKNRQPASTGEGAVGVAGAVVVNIQDSESRAEVPDGVNLKASLAAITSLNGTTSRARANASTTNSNYGIGVGVSVNIVNLKNIASMGDGEIEAAMLTVTAKTKETQPVAQSATETVKKDVKDEDDAKSELSEMVYGYIKDLAKEIGLDKMIPDDMLEDLLSPLVDDVAVKLLQATGLDQLFSSGVGIKESLTKKLQALMDLPEQLIDYIMTVLEENFSPESLMKKVTGVLDAAENELDIEKSAQQLEELLEVVKGELKDEFIKSMKSHLLDYKELLEVFKVEGLNWVKGEGKNILLGMFKGNSKLDNFKTTMKKLGTLIAKGVGKQLYADASASLSEALAKVDIPDVDIPDPSRIVDAFNEIKDTFSASNLERIFNDAGTFVTETFRTNVFDYEAMFNGVQNTDFKKLITDGLREVANKAMAVLSNAAVSKLVSTLGVELEAEQEKATGHIIQTEAISGAGAKSVGIAGSVAITLLDADTHATIADGGSIKVATDMLVEATELRSVTNIATAALDAKGKPDTNKKSEDESNKDVGGGSDAMSTASNESNTLKLSVGAGGTAEIRQGDKTDSRPKMYISLKEGYTMPEDNKVEYAYTEKNGTKKTGTIEAKKDGDQWVVDVSSDSTLKKLAKDIAITLQVQPLEALQELPDPEMLWDPNLTEDAEAVTVSVEGREKKDGKVSARSGETVEIHVKKGEGRKLQEIGYSYTDEKGKVHDVAINPSAKSTKKEKAVTLVASNENEYIFSIIMPKTGIDAIAASFVKPEEGEEDDKAKSSATTSTGVSVGVGAAFSMVNGDSSVHATVGKREITAGTLTAKGETQTVGTVTVNAASDHLENISSAAGTDPMSGDLNMENSKKIGLDASVALDILDNDIKAVIAPAATVDVKGWKEGTEKDSLAVTATENTVTETTSSAFAVGSTAAVGASVALNLVDTSVNAGLEGGAKVAGSATVSANTHSEDTTKALATAMGADMARTVSKVSDKLGNTFEEKANKVLDGSALSDEDSKDNKTANGINDKLNKKKEDGGKKAVSGQSTSSNALGAMNVQSDNGSAGSDAVKGGLGEVNGAAGSKLANPTEQKKTSVMVAAAVGLTIASHEASTKVGGIEAGNRITVSAENTGNFNTMGTGAAMSLAEKSNAIAMGVAVSVNSNASDVTATGDLISKNNEDITVVSRMTQNMDGDFAGKLAAQSLAGSVAGKKGGISLAGAVSVVTSKAHSTVNIAGGSEKSRRSIQGGNITVDASDKSKLAARAGGLSISKGAAVGMGVASTTIVSSNKVSATLGNYTDVTAKSFALNAAKKEVTFSDYKNLVDMRYLVTDSSALTDEQRKNANTGLFDFHKGPDDKNYKLEVNLSSEKLLDAVDGLNFLSSQNTYAEAIAGALGSTKAASGSFAVSVSKNRVDTTLGSDVTIKTTQGDAVLNATNGNNARIIAGAVSVANGQSGAGVTIAVMVNNDEVTNETGEKSVIDAQGSITRNAAATGKQQVFTVAASAASGGSQDAEEQTTTMGSSLGGAINVIVSKTVAKNKISDTADLYSNAGSIKNNSSATYDLMAISGSAALNAGLGSAAGGTINVIVDETTAETSMGQNVYMEAAKAIQAGSDVSDQLISGTLSLSAAPKTGGSSVAGVVNVIVSRSAANTKAGTEATLDAQGGDLDIHANNDAWLLNASMTGSLGGESGLGGAFNVNVLNRSAQVELSKNSTLTASGDLKAQSSGKNTDIIVALAAAGATTGDSLAGNIGVVVENNNVKTTLGDDTTATAGRNALIESYYSDYTVDAAGSIVAGATSAVGATIMTIVKKNVVTTELGKSTVTANGTAENKAKSGDKFTGVYVGANAKETQFIGGAGIAASGVGSTNINGVIVTLVNSNKVKSDASKATLTANAGGWKYGKVTIAYKPVNSGAMTGTRDMAGLEKMINRLRAGELEWLDFYEGVTKDQRKRHRIDPNNIDASYDILQEKSGQATVTARDNTKQMLLAGGISVSAGSGIGAAVVTVVSNKNVQAKAHDMTAWGDVNVTADNHDDLAQLALSAGVGGEGAAIQAGIAVQVLKSKAIAEVGSKVVSTNGKFNLQAKNDTEMTNAAAGVAASAGEAAVSPVAAVTYFQGDTKARLKSGSVVQAKDAEISTSAKKDINLYTIGVTAGTGAGISGAANVLVSRDTNLAVAEEGTDLTLKNNLDIKSNSDYTLRAASGTLALSADAGVGVNAVVSVMKGNAVAELAGKATAGNKVSVDAYGKRDVVDIAANAAGGGTAGVGVTVMVLAAGAPMSQDAADMIMYGDGDKDGEKSGLDTDLLMKTAENGNNGASQYYDEKYETDENGDVLKDEKGNPVKKQSMAQMLNEDLEGNGHYESQENVGHTDQKERKNTFDGANGYYSNDFNDTRKAKKYSDDDAKERSDPNLQEKGRGEDLQATDTADIKNAKAVNSFVYKSLPSDAVIAIIDETATVEAKRVEVKAEQPVAVDLVGATMAIGGTAGVGVSAAVAVLHSNVLASSLGTIKNATKGVSVKAYSSSGTFDPSKETKENSASARDDTIKKALNHGKKTVFDRISGRNIRVFGLAASVGGDVSAAVSVAVAYSDNVTSAILGGRVTNAGNIDVHAEQNFESVLAATGSLSASLGGAVGASVSVAQANGQVTSLITADGVPTDKNGKKTGNDIQSTGDVNVTSKSVVNADAVAITAGAGALSVNAGVALAINRLYQETGIIEGVKVKATDTVKVHAESETTANSDLIGIAVGAGAGSLNAAVSDVAATINTHVGALVPVENRSKIKDSDNMPDAVIQARTLEISNKVSSAAKPEVLSVTAGGVAMGGNILLAFNDTQAKAALERADVEAVNVKVAGNLSGTADSQLEAATLSLLAAAGISVNYADMQAQNRAEITKSTIDASNITVLTNENNESTSAKATTASVSMGAFSVGMNAGIARNHTLNYATIIGDRNINTAYLTMDARGTSTATADMDADTASGISIAASAVVALNDADARATLVMGNTEDTRDESGKVIHTEGVKDVLNVTGDMKFNANQNAATAASLHTGGGSLVSAKVSVAMAYGRAASVVDVAINGGGKYGSITATNNATDIATSTIANKATELASVSAYYGAAYSQDVIYNKVQLTGGDYTVNGDVNMKTNYTVTGDADLSPSPSGLDIKLGSLGVNMALARNTAYASSDMEFSMGEQSKVTGKVNVKTTGKAYTKATVGAAKLSVQGASLTSNIAKADLSMTQAAALRVGGKLTVEKGVNVESYISKDGGIARASVGNATADSAGMKISIASLDVNYAIARENMANSAAILGAAYKADEVDALVDMGSYQTNYVEMDNYDEVDNVDYQMVRSSYAVFHTTESEDDFKANMLKYYIDSLNGVRDYSIKWKYEGGLKFGFSVTGKLGKLTEFRNMADQAAMMDIIRAYDNYSKLVYKYARVIGKANERATDERMAQSYLKIIKFKVEDEDGNPEEAEVSDVSTPFLPMYLINNVVAQAMQDISDTWTTEKTEKEKAAAEKAAEDEANAINAKRRVEEKKEAWEKITDADKAAALAEAKAAAKADAEYEAYQTAKAEDKAAAYDQAYAGSELEAMDNEIDAAWKQAQADEEAAAKQEAEAAARTAVGADVSGEDESDEEAYREAYEKAYAEKIAERKAKFGVKYATEHLEKYQEKKNAFNQQFDDAYAADFAEREGTFREQFSAKFSPEYDKKFAEEEAAFEKQFAADFRAQFEEDFEKQFVETVIEPAKTKEYTFGDFLKALEKDEELREKTALRSAILYADAKYDEDATPFEFEETLHYRKEKVEVTEWVPEFVERKVLVAVYDADKNFLTVNDNLNVKAGVESGAKTGAEARTDEAKNFGAFSAGSTKASSKSTDTISVMLEGMHATVNQTATLEAKSNTTSAAVGKKAGGITGFKGGSANMVAKIGSSDDRQTVAVVIGEGSELNAKNGITINTENLGSVEASFKEDSSKSIAAIAKSKQPTESWYTTLVTIGKGAQLTSEEGAISIVSKDVPTAKSIVKTSNVGFAMNFSTMKGQNFVNQENNLDIGEGAVLTSKGNMTLKATQFTKAEAGLTSNGGGLINKGKATAENYISRIARVNIAKSVKITSQEGDLSIYARGGEDAGDSIITRSTVNSKGLAAIGTANSYTEFAANNEVLIDENVQIQAKNRIWIAARNDSHSSKEKTYKLDDKNTRAGYEAGVLTEAIVDSKGGVPVPKGIAKEMLNITNYVGINRAQEERDEKGKVQKDSKGNDIFKPSQKTTITSTNGLLRIHASNYSTLEVNSKAIGKGIGGVADSTSWIGGDIAEAVWIDNAELKGDNIEIYANTGVSKDRTHLMTSSYAELKALTGKVAPTARISGLRINQVRSNDTSKVIMNANTKTVTKTEPIWGTKKLFGAPVPYITGYKTYTVEEPIGTVKHNYDGADDIWSSVSANFKRWQKKILGVTITLTKSKVTKAIETGVFNRCDFCNKGTKYDVRPTGQDETMDERYEDAYKRALAPINTVAAMARSLAQDQSALTAMRVSKGLAPITYLNTLAPTTTVIFKARYGEEENEAADKIYLLDVKAMLNNDARLTPTQTAHYQLWQNSQTYHNVFMLPNAARLYLRYTTLDYVTDILHGDLTGDGEADDIEVISALNAYAYENPIIPIGSTGTLNFANGDLTIPAYSDFELYLSEVSAAWLTDSLKSGYIRTMAAEQDAINAFAEDGVSVPDGAVLQVLIDGGEAEGCKLYWIGPDPEEEIEDPDKTLVLLVVNEETDEVEAFRTTAAKLAANEDPIPVSLFMYRDSQSDRQEDEKYNTFWFDTPENQKAIVKVVTDVLGDRQLEMPRPMHVVLRASKLEGTTLPVYALSDHIFVMNDGHTGSVSLFDGFYQATFDGETFESGFTKVEGIGSGDPTVTVKQDQPVWPEKTSEKTAEDLNGTKYTSDDNGEWTAEPVLSENEPADAA